MVSPRGTSMLDARRNRSLVSTAMALVLAVPALIYTAGDLQRNALAATPGEAVASPETVSPSVVPPNATGPVPDLAGRIPLPEPADLPPPGTADLGGPATGTVIP